MAAPDAATGSTSQAHNCEASISDSLHCLDDSTTREPVAFPSLTPLSHHLELLSPVHTSNFSVDEFLVSRTKASDLNFILGDLRSYSEKLKDELYSIINEDYKDFVSLGSSLKAEAHRIARLGWSRSSRPLNDDEEKEEEQDGPPPQGLMVPVRDTLLASRSMLKSVQDDIADSIRRKEDATSHKARLELMLQLHDSIVRLEDLLLIQPEKGKGGGRRRSSRAVRRPSVMNIGSVGGRRDSLASVASGSDQDLSEYAMSSDYDKDSESNDDASSSEEAQPAHTNGDALQPKQSRRKIIRRLSSAAHHPHTTPDRPSLSPSRTRTQSGTLAGPSTSTSASSSLLGLPQRIARTSAEYSRLRFLHRRIDEENLTDFADALADRIDSIRSVLRQDLRTLLRALLTSPHSLLLYGRSSALLPSSPELRKSRPSATGARRASFLQSLSTKPAPSAIVDRAVDELDAWSQIAEPVVEEGEKEVEAAYWEARLDEQRSWLEMALSTLNTLTLVRRDEQQKGESKRRNEAEEAVRDLLVSDWAAKNIIDKPPADDTTDTEAFWSGLPETLRSQLQEHRTHVQSLLLASPSSTPSIQLSNVYNSILTFVASAAWHVTDASREISLQTSAACTTDLDGTTTSPAERESQCDIFTNVIWDELSTHLLTTLGNTIFFVGQTDTFYSNFTLTNTFLQRLLSLAPTQEAKLAVQDHPNWLAFKRRWQLPVYFQMRFREVITTLEAAFAEGRAKVEEQAGGKLMKATQATLAAIEKLWSDGVHIHELSAREWRVTLQILSRYKSWIEEQSPAELGGMASNRNLDALRSTGGAGSGEGSGRSSFDQSQQQRVGSMEVSRVGTPQSAPDLSSQQHEDEQLQLATELLADSLALQERMEAMLDDVIFPRITSDISAHSQDLSSLREDLAAVLREESMDFISPGLVSAVGRLAYKIITPRSAAPLRLLRSYSTPSYRPSSTSGSRAASVQVIEQLLQPLETFLSLPPLQSIPTEIKRSWISKILNDIFQRYTNTIETINKNQQSLLRLKKSQTGGLLGGLLKSTPNSKTDRDAEMNMIKTNKQALSTFENKVKALQLEIDLEKLQGWNSLKSFLKAQADTP
ncbi:related to conserved oligomeric Golgi complex component 2 [Ustilago sp. UG-2017a]|nr:related to conserved oligomeric Golgi complex component 2 [Ustilago sp. UG-2017a]